MTRKLFFGILFATWTVMLVLLSVWPYTDTTTKQSLSEFRWDYLEHFGFYFILTFLYILWRSDLNYSIRIKELIIFLFSGFIFSCLSEYVQIFIPGRSFNIIDMLFNIAGIILGIFICYYLLIRLIVRNYIRSKT
jgi:VanZ family protein